MRNWDRAFSRTLANARFVSADQIWLALDDEPIEGRRQLSENLLMSGLVSLRECEQYHRQLFYWLLIRGAPRLFSLDSGLAQGVPKQIQYQN